MNPVCCWLLSGLDEDNRWWLALLELERSVAANDGTALTAYLNLYRSLVASGHDSVASALAGELLYGKLPVSHAALETGSLRQAYELDLQRLNQLANVNWQQVAGSQLGQPLPALKGLARTADPEAAGLADLLEAGRTGVHDLLAIWSRQGQGSLAEGRAWRWRDGQLDPIPSPARASFESLHGLEAQLTELRRATERWLEGGSRLNMLLYGPRGSGKSTAARALLHSYARDGLRMIEAAPAELDRLPDLLELLRESPLKFVLFVDDLSFGTDAGAWQQLKTLLEGTLQAVPDNLVVLATSNRRRLVKQQFSDRPDPLDDDANAWDTQDEKLALADRFGLVINFPAADQRRYLDIVARLAKERGLDAAELAEEAMLFARRGNGMSGRSAQQFIDSVD